MWLFVALLAVPIIEIALFIQVGGWIGLWPTLAIVIATAVAGSWLVRSQGLAAIGQLRGSLNELRDPTEPLAHGAMIVFAGALLLTPGFFTDTVGFLLLLPPVRRALMRYLAKRISVQRFSVGPDPRQDPRTRSYRGGSDTIDGEFHEIPPENPSLHPPGGRGQD